jgi:hypothetical protein
MTFAATGQVQDHCTKPPLLLKYYNFVNVFSKTENSSLPPHRPIDHKMELLPDSASLRAHPLYNMSADQLIALKEYLMEALRKK